MGSVLAAIFVCWALINDPGGEDKKGEEGGPDLSIFIGILMVPLVLAAIALVIALIPVVLAIALVVLALIAVWWLLSRLIRFLYRKASERAQRDDQQIESMQESSMRRSRVVTRVRETFTKATERVRSMAKRERAVSQEPSSNAAEDSSAPKQSTEDGSDPTRQTSSRRFPRIFPVRSRGERKEDNTEPTAERLRRHDGTAPRRGVVAFFRRDRSTGEHDDRVRETREKEEGIPSHADERSTERVSDDSRESSRHTPHSSAVVVSGPQKDDTTDHQSTVQRETQTTAVENQLMESRSIAGKVRGAHARSQSHAGHRVASHDTKGHAKNDPTAHTHQSNTAASSSKHDRASSHSLFAPVTFLRRIASAIRSLPVRLRPERSVPLERERRSQAHAALNLGADLEQNAVVAHTMAHTGHVDVSTQLRRIGWFTRLRMHRLRPH